MSNNKLTRRQVIAAALAAAPLHGVDWDALPQARAPEQAGGKFDAIIIGSGLGGLSCAAAFARKGYRTLVLEQHDKPGGYATAFRRRDFTFDVSLHSTSVGERNGAHNLIGNFPEITEVEFAPHPDLYRVIFPQHDIRVPQRDVPAYAALLARHFPEEKPGIDGLLDDMRALLIEIGKLSAAQGKVDMSRFPKEFPMLVRCSQQTWAQMAAARIRDPKLMAIVSAQWPYYGLPPSKLSSFYYALPALGYLSEGGYYPKGRSQTISDALVKFIETRGGKVMLRTRVERILTKEGAAYGVRCAGGLQFEGRAIVSNASARHTFDELLSDGAALEKYKEQMAGYSVSLSCFQVFLGLKRDLIGDLGIKDSEIFIETGYDPDVSYEAVRKADLANGGLALTLYDNIFQGYSPKGKNTLNILTLQGFEHWEKFEADYRAGRKTAYRAEKQKMADLLIRRAEKALLPGLTKAVEVMEIGTPLTNLRYTGNYRGAIYGWDQTVANSGARRVGHSTPVKNLYLASAWSRPGHGYGAVLQSGPECFAEIVRAWG